MSNPHDSWYHERESAWLYRVVAEADADQRHQQLFRALSQAAEEQAAHWARLARPGEFRPRMRARLVARLVRWLGPRALRPVLAAMKLRGLSVYSGAAAVDGHLMPVTVQDVGQRHRSVTGGNNLRAAVFGVNDGLVSNLSLILGVAGAGASAQVILTSGLAGLLAGSLSMASGEYVSVRSQREMYEYQIGLERDELAEYPAEEAEELALIYQARGVELEQARSIAARLMANPDHALNTLAREELGLNPDDLASPWAAAAFSFCAFGSGALLPLVPYLTHIASGSALYWSAGTTMAALFGVGMALSLFNGRNSLHGGARMLLIGAAAAGCTWAVGHFLGAALG
ncbi:MAG: VIT1/CCC1 transporter family protein [Gammaproteobacteria bacterium]|nr:VIT1/CCC1 transporter family protein [Gammaproteobacteria bacterium]MDE2251785.1 VIT1/CCC1 transporter family protein [Gammaproteobacteria bacterium]